MMDLFRKFFPKKIFYAEDRLFIKKFIEERVWKNIKRAKIPTRKNNSDLLVIMPHVGVGSGCIPELKQYPMGSLEVKEAHLRLPSKKKMFWTGENTAYKCHNVYDDYCLDRVDFAFGFKKIDDPRYLHLPLWILYLFAGCKTKEEVNKKVDEINNKKYKKTKFCALIASHDNTLEYADKKYEKDHIEQVRTKIYQLMCTIDKVSCPGKLFHNDESLKNDFGEKKKDYLESFKFNICPENGLGEGYCTEKLFQAFEAGCVPIYWGVKGEELEKFINPSSFLFYDGENEKEIFAKVKELNDNDVLYDEFISQEKLRPEIVDFIWSRLEGLEIKLAELLEVKK